MRAAVADTVKHKAGSEVHTIQPLLHACALVLPFDQLQPMYLCIRTNREQNARRATLRANTLARNTPIQGNQV